MRPARALWRLLRSTLHVLHGLAIVLLRFDAMSQAEREACTRWWARKVLRLMGIAMQVEGEALSAGCLVISNHVSWLDIMAIQAVMPQSRFVSKADVKSWPLLSRLIDGGGTLYLQRERKRDALRVVHQIGEALAKGQTVAVFPEGTTSDGQRLLPFHANLLQAAISVGSEVQPVALCYSDAHSSISAAAEFVGDTTLVQSLWRIASADGLVVHVALLPREAGEGAERRELAARLHDRIAARLARRPASTSRSAALQALP